MRKTFLYPIFQKVKEKRFGWIFEQVVRGFTIKYLNRLLPKKIITGPVMAVLLVTYRCNSKCLMCDLPMRALTSTESEYSTNQWKEVIKQLAEIKTGGIGFTGGEPLVRSDIFELIRYARSLGLVTTLNTNGVLLLPDKIKNLLVVEPENINISLDGVNGETYDYVRGTPHGFVRMTDNVRNLVKERNRLKKSTMITMVTCVSEYNIEELDKIADLAACLGADKIGFMPMHKIPDTKVYQNPRLRPLTCKSNYPRIGEIFLDKITKIKADSRISIDNSSSYIKMFPKAFNGDTFPIRCQAGETSLTVDCYGNIFGCWPFLELKQPSLTLKKKTIKNLWFRPEYDRVRKITNHCRACFWNCQSELSVFYQ